MRHPSPSRGFTLIELLVVIAIIAVLIGLLLSSRGGVKPPTVGGRVPFFTSEG